MSKHKIALYKSEVYLLPAMNINKSLTTGNAKVIDTILKELKQDTSNTSFLEQVKFIAGDQLSLKQLRTVGVILRHC